MKLTLEEIQEVLSKKVKDTAIVNSILKELEKVVDEKKEEKGEIKMTGYFKYKEGDGAGLMLSRMSGAAARTGEGKKKEKIDLCKKKLGILVTNKPRIRVQKIV